MGPPDLNITKEPKGIMIKVENESFWKDCYTCFVSFSENDLTRGEMWFHRNHTHDKGAVQHSLKYIVPGIYSPHENELVRLENRVADERGVKYIEIDPGKYTGTEEMKMSVI